MLSGDDGALLKSTDSSCPHLSYRHYVLTDVEGKTLQVNGVKILTIYHHTSTDDKSKTIVLYCKFS